MNIFILLNIYSQLRSNRSWLFSKNNCPQKQPWRYTFQFDCSEFVVKFWTSPKRFSQPRFQLCNILSALRILCLLLLMICCLLHFNRKPELKKGNTQTEFKYRIRFFARANKWFVWHQRYIDFKGNLADGKFIRKCVYREFDVTVFMIRWISLGERFLRGEHLMSSRVKTTQTIDFKLSTRVSNRMLNGNLLAIFLTMCH